MTTVSKAFFPAVTVSRASGRSTATLQLKVPDALVREQLRGFDGLQTAFALVPSERQGQVSWKKVPLQFGGSAVAGYYNRTFVDLHGGAVKNADAKAIAKYGVAFKGS
jgi:hypothetical protein